MSSDLFPTVKSKKHVLLTVGTEAMIALIDDGRIDRRSLSYVVSKIVEDYYEGKSELKVV